MNKNCISGSHRWSRTVLKILRALHSKTGTRSKTAESALKKPRGFLSFRSTAVYHIENWIMEQVEVNFDDCIELLEYSEIDEEQKENVCDLCQIKFPTMSRLLRHTNEKHTSNKTYEKLTNNKTYEDRLKCEDCGQIFTKFYSLNRHKAKVHDKVTFDCDRCVATFTRLDSLKRHILCVHDKIKSHKCTLCPKGYTDKRTLNNHMLAVHQNLRQYLCNLCHKIYTDKSSLKKHFVAVHNLQAYQDMLESQQHDK